MHAPLRAEIPVLVECPHAGLDVPASLASVVAGPESARRRDADFAVDRLCDGVCEVGATRLVAQLSRYVVDLNRAPDDIDPFLHGASFDRRGPPKGVVWRVATDGRPIARRPLSPDEVRARVDAYHRPYHDALASTLTSMRTRFDHVVMLAVHSMPSIGKIPGTDDVVRRADVVPGTRGRTTAAVPFIDEVDTFFRAEGFSVRHDDPYRGGYSTALYGRPDRGVHAIQIELSRGLYLDEPQLRIREADVARLRDAINRLVERLGMLATEFGKAGSGDERR